MWDTEPRKVLVGVETPRCEAALHFAVDEAVRRGCGIHLVHVTHPAMWASCAMDDIALVEGELRRTDQLVLAETAARAQAMLDERAPQDDRLSLSTELSHGSVAPTLQSLSSHAGLLVLEHEGMGPHGDAATHSVTARLAAGSHCAVVAVPDTWRPGDGTGVVVGVEDPVRDVAAIEAARREADRRRTRLREVRLQDGPLVESLLHQADGADLVVVARHHRKHALGSPLGGTAAALLQHCPVPVMVVGPET